MENTTTRNTSSLQNLSPKPSYGECTTHKGNKRGNNIKKFRIKHRVRPKKSHTNEQKKRTFGSLVNWVSDSPIARYFSKSRQNKQNNDLQTHEKKNGFFKNDLEKPFKSSTFDPENNPMAFLPSFGQEFSLACNFEKVIPVILSIQSESDLSRNSSRPSAVHKSMSFYHARVSDEDFNKTITDPQDKENGDLSKKDDKKNLEKLEKWFCMEKEYEKGRNDNNGLTSNKSETKIKINKEFVNRCKSEFSILNHSKKRREQKSHSKPALSTIKPTLSLISELLNSECLPPNIFISRYEENSTPSPISFASQVFKQASFNVMPGLFKSGLTDDKCKNAEYNYSHKVEEIRCTTQQTMHLCNEILDAMTDLRGNILMKQNEFFNYNGRNQQRFMTPYSFNSFTNADLNDDYTEENTKEEIQLGLGFTKWNFSPKHSFKDGVIEPIMNFVPTETIVFKPPESINVQLLETKRLKSQSFTDNGPQNSTDVDCLELSDVRALKPSINNFEEMKVPIKDEEKVKTAVDDVEEKSTEKVCAEKSNKICEENCIKSAKKEDEIDGNVCENNENENPEKKDVCKEIDQNAEDSVESFSQDSKKHPLEKLMESEKIGVKLLKSRRKKQPTKCGLSLACHNVKKPNKQRGSNNHNKTILNEEDSNNKACVLKINSTIGTSKMDSAENATPNRIAIVSSSKPTNKRETLALLNGDSFLPSNSGDVKTLLKKAKPIAVDENNTSKTQKEPEITKETEEAKRNQAVKYDVKTENSAQKNPVEVEKIKEKKEELRENIEPQNIICNIVTKKPLTSKKEAGAGENCDKNNVKNADGEKKKTENKETYGLDKCELKIPFIDSDTTPLLFYESLDAKIREVGTLIVKLKNGQQIVRKNNCSGNIKSFGIVEKAVSYGNKAVNKEVLMQILEEFDPLMSPQRQSSSTNDRNSYRAKSNDRIKIAENKKPCIYYNKTFICEEEEDDGGKTQEDEDRLSYEMILKRLTEAVNSGLFFQKNEGTLSNEDSFSLKNIAFNWLMGVLKNVFKSSNVKYSSPAKMKSPRKAVNLRSLSRGRTSPTPVQVYTSQNLSSIYRLTKKLHLKRAQHNFNYTNLLENFNKQATKNVQPLCSYKDILHDSSESIDDSKSSPFRKVRIHEPPRKFSPKIIPKKKPILKTQKSLSRSADGRKKKSVILPDDVIDEKSFSKRPVSPLLAEDVKKLFENVDSNIKIYTKLLNGYTKCSDPMLALSYQEPRLKTSPERGSKSPKPRKNYSFKLKNQLRISPLKTLQNNFQACKSGVVSKNLMRHVNKSSSPSESSRYTRNYLTGVEKSPEIMRSSSNDLRFSFRTTEKFERTLAMAKKRSKQKASRHLFLLKKQPFKKNTKTKKTYPKKYFAQDCYVNKFTRSFEVLPPSMKFKSKDLSKCFLTVRMISSERKFSSKLKHYKKKEISPVERYFLKDIQKPCNQFDAIKNLNVFSCQILDQTVMNEITKTCLKVNSSPNNSKNCSKNTCPLELTLECGMENKVKKQHEKISGGKNSSTPSLGDALKKNLPNKKISKNENYEEKENQHHRDSLSSLSSLKQKESKESLDTRKIKSEITVSSSEKSFKSSHSLKVTDSQDVNVGSHEEKVSKEENGSHKASTLNAEENGWSLSKCRGFDNKEVSDLEEMAENVIKEHALNKIEEWSLSSVGKFKKSIYEKRRDGKMEGYENCMVEKRSDDFLVSRLNSRNSVEEKMNEKYRDYLVKNSLNNKNEDSRFFLSDANRSEKREKNDEDGEESYGMERNSRKKPKTRDEIEMDDLESMDRSTDLSYPFLTQKSKITESESKKKTSAVNRKHSDTSTEELFTPYGKVFESVSPIETEKSVDLPFNSLSTGSVYQESQSSFQTCQPEIFHKSNKEYSDRFNAIGFKSSYEEVKPYKTELKEEFNMFKRYLPTYNYSPDDKLLKSSPPQAFFKPYENFSYTNPNTENDLQADSVFQIFSQQKMNMENPHYISNRFSMRN